MLCVGSSMGHWQQRPRVQSLPSGQRPRARLRRARSGPSVLGSQGLRLCADCRRGPPSLVARRASVLSVMVQISAPLHSRAARATPAPRRRCRPARCPMLRQPARTGRGYEGGWGMYAASEHHQVRAVPSPLHVRAYMPGRLGRRQSVRKDRRSTSLGPAGVKETGGGQPFPREASSTSSTSSVTGSRERFPGRGSGAALPSRPPTRTCRHA